jgi:hypothetical protein
MTADCIPFAVGVKVIANLADLPTGIITLDGMIEKRGFVDVTPVMRNGIPPVFVIVTESWLLPPTATEPKLSERESIAKLAFVRPRGFTPPTVSASATSIVPTPLVSVIGVGRVSG